MSRLDFDYVADANVTRSTRWHDGATDWSGGDWACAMAGEAGEACNVVKKLRRIETGQRSSESSGELWLKLRYELADTILYTLLLANHYAIDLPSAIVDKFNNKSEEQGFPDRIWLSEPGERTSTLRSQVGAIHYPVEEDGIAAECVDGECAHFNATGVECPVVKFHVCAHCAHLANHGEPWDDMIPPDVMWPCPTAKIAELVT